MTCPQPLGQFLVGYLSDWWEGAHSWGREALESTQARRDLSPTDREQRREREDQRRRHYGQPDQQEPPGADLQAFAARGREPQDGGERARDRQVGPENDTDHGRAR